MIRLRFCSNRYLKTRIYTHSLLHKSEFSSSGNIMAVTSQSKILNYWLGDGWESKPWDEISQEKFKMWFSGSPEVDSYIIDNFKDDCHALLDGNLDAWHSSEDIKSTLAAVILGDQFSRNCFRGSAKMYEADEKVLKWSKEVISKGLDKSLHPIARVWFYLPLMHSENLEDQDECIELYIQLNEEVEARGGREELKNLMKGSLNYAQSHRDVIAKWGRFPHRNAILGRESTAEELDGIANGTIAKW
jgi:uncharacterized protein (DUF924 family)